MIFFWNLLNILITYDGAWHSLNTCGLVRLFVSNIYGKRGTYEENKIRYNANRIFFHMQTIKEDDISLSMQLKLLADIYSIINVICFTIYLKSASHNKCTSLYFKLVITRQINIRTSANGQRTSAWTSQFSVSIVPPGPTYMLTKHLYTCI